MSEVYDLFVKQPYSIREGLDQFFEVSIEPLFAIMINEKGLNYDFHPEVHGIELALFGLAKDFLEHLIADKVEVDTINNVEVYY